MKWQKGKKQTLLDYHIICSYFTRDMPGPHLRDNCTGGLHFHEKHSPLLEFPAFTSPLPHLGLQVILTLQESEAWLTAFLPTFTRSPLNGF